MLLNGWILFTMVVSRTEMILLLREVFNSQGTGLADFVDAHPNYNGRRLRIMSQLGAYKLLRLESVGSGEMAGHIALQTRWGGCNVSCKSWICGGAWSGIGKMEWEARSTGSWLSTRHGNTAVERHRYDAEDKRVPHLASPGNETLIPLEVLVLLRAASSSMHFLEGRFWRVYKYGVYVCICTLHASYILPGMHAYISAIPKKKKGK